METLHVAWRAQTILSTLRLVDTQVNRDAIMLEALAAVLSSNHQFRLGQAVYNAARERYPAVVVNLAGSRVDPFYDSSRIRAFLARLTELCGRIEP